MRLYIKKESYLSPSLFASILIGIKFDQFKKSISNICRISFYFTQMMLLFYVDFFKIFFFKKLETWLGDVSTFDGTLFDDTLC